MMKLISDRLHYLINDVTGEYIMGLIDEIRRNRDSWTQRFEEHRIEEEYDHEFEKNNTEKIEQEIMKKRQSVGVFPDLK